ncbi:MAG TPA: YkgJ family cysteine cluster protein [Polyangiaceae bacterium]|nr:YkgJ family cysteine cluster protein [Polyangiaceae bacterium]
MKPDSQAGETAGAFSPWLRRIRRSQKLKTVGADVPCGSCTACCRSSYFIHIKADEKRTLARIPRKLLFPAPGPKGNMLMGYNERGECPMFVENRCAIYEDRPQTCRDYDCRIYAATGVAVDRALIDEQVRRWRFEHRNELDRREHAAVRAAAEFLQERGDAIGEGVPSNPARLALLAIEVYDLFLKLDESSASGGRRPSDTEIAKAVIEAMSQIDGR